MPVEKKNIAVPLSLGLDQKTDKWQVKPGKFLALRDYVFQKGGKLTKRYGFPRLTSLPAEALATTLTTFNDNLTAIGTSLYAYNRTNGQWLNRGRMQPVQLSVLPMVRTAISQEAPDIAVNASGVAVCAFIGSDGVASYQVLDTLTGQAIVPVTSLPAGTTQVRTAIVGTSFVMVFLRDIAGVPHLQFIALPFVDPSSPTAAADLSTQVSSVTAGFDLFSTGSTIYVAWDGSDVGGAIRVSSLGSNLVQGSTVAIPLFSADLMSVTVDSSGTTPVVWVTFWKAGDAYAMALSQILVTILAPTQYLTGVTITTMTSTAWMGMVTSFYQIQNTYSYSSVRTDYIEYTTIDTLGTVGTPTEVARSVGLASKAFILGESIYMLAAYGGSYQPSYFLIDSTGSVVGKVAYSNGGGYATTQVLPSVSLYGNVAHVAYLLKDLIIPVNKNQNLPSTAGVYAQTGVNLATFDLSADKPLITAEIGGSLHVAGGIVWQYDGIKPVELGFNVWPEDIGLTTSAAGGAMTAQTYFYKVTYEWTDAAGNIHRSAPSVPQSVTTTGSTSSNTLDVPMLRLTHKTDTNKVRIVIYRWSTNQQTYYQITSVATPIINDPTMDSYMVIDGNADSGIIGNNILYTTGGIVENIAPPPPTSLTLFKNRFIVLDAEDRNRWWFSKQVIEATPVEMSDLFTKFVAPTQGSSGSTGPLFAIAPLDDKLILFKESAQYYVAGEGPDNLGANDDFTEPTYITSAVVGTTNQRSVTLTPNGLMFDAGNQVWLLSRSLDGQYIGDAIEVESAFEFNSAYSIPNTNQVRFVLNNKTMLMYDYYYNQWGTFSTQSAISSCIYQGMHTYLSAAGDVYQETIGSYLDGERPVLGSWTTSWFNLTGLQGFERTYFLYLLGQYYSPHKALLTVAYDYNDAPVQSILLSPDLFSPNYGGDPFYGDGSPYGGPGNVEQFRIFMKKQKCQAFQLTFKEQFDPSFGTTAGQGLSLSGLNLTVGAKSTYPRLSAKKSYG